MRVGGGERYILPLMEINIPIKLVQSEPTFPFILKLEVAERGNNSNTHQCQRVDRVFFRKRKYNVN